MLTVYSPGQEVGESENGSILWKLRRESQKKQSFAEMRHKFLSDLPLAALAERTSFIKR